VSARIGEIHAPSGLVLARVLASLGGVEVKGDVPNDYTVQPIEARNAAALLVRAADEVERMRHPEVSTSVAYETDFAVDPVKYPRVSSAHSLLAEELKDLLRDARADAVQYVKDVKADELRRAYERGKAEGGKA
jgi:hypothetical protein